MEPENTGIPENLNFSGQGDFGGPTPEYLEKKAQAEKSSSKEQKRFFVQQYLDILKNALGEDKYNEFGPGFWQLYESQCNILYDKYQPKDFKYFAELAFVMLTGFIIYRGVDWKQVNEFMQPFMPKKVKKDDSNNPNQ